MLSQQEMVTAMLEILTATLYEYCRGKKWDFLLAVLIIHTYTADWSRLVA